MANGWVRWEEGSGTEPTRLSKINPILDVMASHASTIVLNWRGGAVWLHREMLRKRIIADEMAQG